MLWVVEMLVSEGCCRDGCVSIGNGELLVRCQIINVAWPGCRGAIHCARNIGFDKSNPYILIRHLWLERSLVSEHLNRTSDKIHSAFINTVRSVRGNSVPITFKNQLSGAKHDSPFSGHHYQFLDIVGAVSVNHYHFLDRKKFNVFNKGCPDSVNHYQFMAMVYNFWTIPQHRC